MAAKDITLGEGIDVELLMATALCGGSQDWQSNNAWGIEAREPCNYVNCSDCPLDITDNHLTNPIMFNLFMEINKDKFILKEE